MQRYKQFFKYASKKRINIWCTAKVFGECHTEITEITEKHSLGLHRIICVTQLSQACGSGIYCGSLPTARQPTVRPVACVRKRERISRAFRTYLSVPRNVSLGPSERISLTCRCKGSGECHREGMSRQQRLHRRAGAGQYLINWYIKLNDLLAKVESVLSVISVWQLSAQNECAKQHTIKNGVVLRKEVDARCEWFRSSHRR